MTKESNKPTDWVSFPKIYLCSEVRVGLGREKDNDKRVYKLQTRCDKKRDARTKFCSKEPPYWEGEDEGTTSL
jgi:hypothetical protein